MTAAGSGPRKPIDHEGLPTRGAFPFLPGAMWRRPCHGAALVTALLTRVSADSIRYMGRRPAARKHASPATGETPHALTDAIETLARVAARAGKGDALL